MQANERQEVENGENQADTVTPTFFFCKVIECCSSFTSENVTQCDITCRKKVIPVTLY